ncbi:MAG TPA: Uma2 family endonuclease [Pseudonocardiaceae bacterium]|nr:Uma2 family endonuclease [Pseudonocardiaceae bacterium]
MIQLEEADVSAMPWADHLMSLDDWAALPEDTSHHYELVEGVLQVSPRPASDHQWALTELAYQLRGQLPTELVALPEVEVVLAPQLPATVRTPDLVVVPRSVAVTSPTRYQSDDVLLAVEVISPGSRERDEVTKLYEYSEAGIPGYWLVDLEDQVSLTAYLLVDGEYEVVGKGGGTVPLTEPVAVTVDMGALLPHRT